MISQYADDSTFIFGDDERSLNTALDIVDRFACCSGLRANSIQHRCYYSGQNGVVVEELRTQKSIVWNYEGTFKLLGIEFDVNSEDITGINYKKA